MPAASAGGAISATGYAMGTAAGVNEASRALRARRSGLAAVVGDLDLLERRRGLPYLVFYLW